MKFEDAQQFHEGLAAIKLDGKIGFVDKTGKLVVPCFYENASAFSGGLAAVRIADKWAIPASFDFADKFSEGRAAIGSGGKFGFIDDKGNPITPVQYERAMGFTNGYGGVLIRVTP
jgi:hypothetical protein